MFPKVQLSVEQLRERYFPTDKMAMKKYNHVKYVILRNLSLEKEITIDISYTYFEINNSNI